MYSTLIKLLERNQRTTPRALFLAGPPGSGKSTVAQDVAGGTTAKFVDIDHIVEFLAQKHHTDLADPDQSAQMYAYARNKHVTRRQHYIQQGYDLVIDGTGRNPEGIQRVKEELEAKGYETGMLFVAVDLETSLQRNGGRARKLDSKFVEDAWHDVMRLVRKYDMMFLNFFYIRNEVGSDHPESESTQARRKARQFFSASPRVNRDNQNTRVGNPSPGYSAQSPSPT